MKWVGLPRLAGQWMGDTAPISASPILAMTLDAAETTPALGLTKGGAGLGDAGWISGVLGGATLFSWWRGGDGLRIERKAFVVYKETRSNSVRSASPSVSTQTMRLTTKKSNKYEKKLSQRHFNPKKTW